MRTNPKVRRKMKMMTKRRTSVHTRTGRVVKPSRIIGEINGSKYSVPVKRSVAEKNNIW